MGAFLLKEKAMGESVFILGAGASVDSGAPLMYNFLDVAEDLLSIFPKIT